MKMNEMDMYKYEMLGGFQGIKFAYLGKNIAVIPF